MILCRSFIDKFLDFISFILLLTRFLKMENRCTYFSFGQSDDSDVGNTFNNNFSHRYHY